jgi:hypothetical protein
MLAVVFILVSPGDVARQLAQERLGLLGRKITGASKQFSGAKKQNLIVGIGYVSAAVAGAPFHTNSFIGQANDDIYVSDD